jgi:hypothetical protein
MQPAGKNWKKAGHEINVSATKKLTVEEMTLEQRDSRES